MSIGSVTRRSALVLALAGLTLGSACSSVYRNHGYVPTDEDLAMVEVGKTVREDLPQLIGRPSSAGLLEGSAWYYVGSRWEYYGARPPLEIDRQVVAVSFGETGVVENVERFGLEKGQVVVLSRRVTDTSIKGVGLVRQLLGSIGRVTAGQLLD